MPVNCVVTAGPTYEPLDKVRRLTNFSTGRLGSLLANDLVEKGHNVLLLISETVNPSVEQKAQTIIKFSTSEDLGRRLESLSGQSPDAIFHTAAVSDFRFGTITDLKGNAVASGKISTGSGVLTAQLVPTQKIIAQLRPWFPVARLVGWKYEVEGDREAVLEKCRQQISSCRTDASVANGPAYGWGFGLVTGVGGTPLHFKETKELFHALARLALNQDTKK